MMARQVRTMIVRPWERSPARPSPRAATWTSPSPLTHPSTTPTTVTLTLAAGSTNPATLGTDTNPALVSTDGGTNWVALTPTVSVPAGSTSLLGPCAHGQ
ncbi:MAG: hypothetical protein IPL70_12305 [Uliginosibacterium sp.]|nr:hypothetical protein [Uliginosibacterium sp.]